MTKMTHMTFLEFLKEHHATTYIGTDDDMPDAFDSWLAQLDGEEYIDLGEQYGDTLRDSVISKKR